jgi:RNA polymerase sigma-70 factor (ECF subfamily)
VISSPLHTLSDVELVEMVKSCNDRTAFNEIVRRHKTHIAYTVYGLLGKGADAEDIGQEVFIRFLRYIENYNGKYALITYLTRIAVNLSLNELRRRKIRRLFSFDEMQEEGVEIAAPSDPDPFDENKARVQVALSRLSDKHRAVAVLRLIDGHSTKDTAHILGLPIGTVLSRLARAQDNLRELLHTDRDQQ